ncbi:hypothetical protein MKX03_014834, partial [Papaver bracteatum]
DIMKSFVQMDVSKSIDALELMVCNISFVNESTRGKESCTTSKQDERASGLSVNTKDKLDGLVKPKFPDFKHKDGGQALWIDGAPKWAISELQLTSGKCELNRNSIFSRIFLGAMLKTQRESSSKSNTKKSSDVSWKNLIDGPTNWWDNKAKRLNPKAPDFRNKVTLEGKWFSSAPSWVSEKLPPIQTY